MSLPHIFKEPEIQELFPKLKFGVLTSTVVIDGRDDELEDALSFQLDALESQLDSEAIRQMPAVKSMKEAYRILGKDPNRYRPAAESLLRRVSKGKGLYRVNAVVDSLNLVSVTTGFSICGYDFEKVKGAITLGKGSPEEPYEGIGRGKLNIENLPVFRDEVSAFGTPTSDSVRTMIHATSNRVLMLVPSFDGDGINLTKTLELLAEYLMRFANGTGVEYEIQ